jgi:hypothetical protein
MTPLPDLLTGMDLANTADMSTPGTDGGTVQGHKGVSVMSGAVSARSQNFRVIMSVGQGPGGNGTGSSANTKHRGGLVGATQGK